MCCGGGGGAPDWFYEASRDQIRQGIDARNEANTTYRSFVQRGREMGSEANQELEAGKFREDSYTSYGNAMRMRDANMASMGVNPGDPRFQRGTDKEGVAMAGQTAAGMNKARAGVEQRGLALETAGATGLAGNDPTGAINAAGNQFRADQASRDANNAGIGKGIGWGLENQDKISSAWGSVSKLWSAADGGEVPSYAEGGYVKGIQRFANGGNVYQRAEAETQQMGEMMPPEQRQNQGIDPVQATRIAKTAVDRVAESTFGHASMVPGLSSTGAGSQASMLAAQNAGFGAEGLAMTAEAALGAEAAGAGAAAGGAGALGAIGAALPWVGGALLIGKALGLKDGGGVPSRANGIGGRQVQGEAMNPTGGKVSGPGGPKDDMVMARLSPGEFVLPVGAVKKFGLDRLEKMRQAGLEFEKQQGIA